MPSSQPSRFWRRIRGFFGEGGVHLNAITGPIRRYNRTKFRADIGAAPNVALLAVPQGIAYAAKLLQAGVATELHSFPGTFHGSSLFTHAAISQREGQEQLAILRRALGITD